MPFKTKSKKISAAGRHTFTFSSNSVLSYGDTKVATTVKNHDSESSKKEIKIESDYKYVRSELVKIVLIAGIIIGLQLALKLSGFTVF